MKLVGTPNQDLIDKLSSEEVSSSQYWTQWATPFFLLLLLICPAMALFGSLLSFPEHLKLCSVVRLKLIEWFIHHSDTCSSWLFGNFTHHSFWFPFWYFRLTIELVDLYSQPIQMWKLPSRGCSMCYIIVVYIYYIKYYNVHADVLEQVKSIKICNESISIFANIIKSWNLMYSHFPSHEKIYEKYGLV